MTDDSLDVLLIEDNPGDARLIEEMLRDAKELTQRIDPDVSEGSRPTIYHETRLEAGRESLSETDPDVVLLDLNLPDSAGLETLSAVVETTEVTPIVVLTGVRDEGVGIEAIQRGAQDYLVKDEVSSALLVRSIHHAIERHRQERERARRREQLETLNRLNEVSQDITHAVITTSSREELERQVCERLVDLEAYRFAWIGEVGRGSQRVVPRASAGTGDGYLDAITVTIDDSDTAEGPTGRAVRTKAPQVIRGIESSPEYGPWREEAVGRGYRSSAAIPISHGELLYGVLNVYATSETAFTEPEREILSRLGDVVGHAITALERKDALMSDAVLELEFKLEGVLDSLVDLSADDGRIHVDKLIRSDDRFLCYGSVAGIPRQDLERATEGVGHIDDVRFLTPGRDEYEVELVTSDVIPLFETIATHGGRVQSLTIEGGEFRLVVEVARGGNTRQLIETVEDDYPGITYVAQRTVERDDPGPPAPSTLEAGLTEKQRSALEMAYFAGYFDWPRTSTGEEIADRLGISPATFTQHLRTAERKFFDDVFGDREEDDRLD